MRMAIILTLFLMNYASQAASPPIQWTVNLYVAVALNTDANRLQGEGPHRCEYVIQISPIENEPKFQSASNSSQDAQQRLALLCIKERCQHVGGWIQKGLQQFAAIGDLANAEFLKTLGHSEASINKILERSKSIDHTQYDATTCENSTALGRMSIVDSCFATPMTCSN